MIEKNDNKEKREEKILVEIKEILREHGLGEELIDEFNLTELSKESHNIPKEIADEIKDKMERYAKIIEEIVQPDHSYSTMHECSSFNEKELEKVNKTLSKMMYCLREYYEADLKAKKEEWIIYVKKSAETWKEVKPALEWIIKKRKESWTYHQEEKKGGEYFG